MIREEQLVLRGFLNTVRTKAIDLWNNHSFHRLSPENLAVQSKFAGFKKVEEALPREVAALRSAVQVTLTFLERDELNLVGIRVMQKDETTEVQLLLADSEGSEFVLKVPANTGPFEHTLLPFADFMGKAPLLETPSAKTPPVQHEPPDSLANLFATLDTLRKQ